MRGARTPDPRGDDEPLLAGLRYECHWPYTPAVKMLGLKSPGVVLLTDPRRDPWFGVELPDGGGYGGQVDVEVCVSEEGSATSVRTLERAPRFPKAELAELQDKILDTWQFKPLIVDGNAKPFCVRIGYPLESWQ
jgi:hypothetical protein